MSSRGSFAQWLYLPRSGWRFHLLTTAIAALTAMLALALSEVIASLGLHGHNIIWFVTPVSMAMLFVWGQRATWGVLLGGLIGLLPWFPWEVALIGALDGALQVSFGVFMVRKFWPPQMPLRPSVRFFAILIGLGVMLPVFLLSLPTVLAFSTEIYFADYFWDSYVGWCISEITGVLIILPPILMLIYPAFGKTVERPRELALYIVLGIALMVAGVVYSFDAGADEIGTLESWVLVATTGFIMIVRNGVGGIIIANLAMASATAIIQILLSREDISWITLKMLNEFNLYTCHLTGLTLIVAAGFYDHKTLSDISRNITARMLNIQVSERRKLAADLHDSVSQEFAAALMHLRSGMLQIPATQQNENILLAEESLNKGLQDLRQTAVGLRPELIEYGAFGDIVQSYCNTFEQRHHVDVLFENGIDESTPTLSLDKREHLFRIIQEALSNAVRHGKASAITVQLLSDHKRKHITARVEDDGVGFDATAGVEMADRPHLGLRLMQERALLIGGTLHISSLPGKGTTIEVSVPFDRPAPEGGTGRSA